MLVLEATLEFKPYFEQSHHFALISEKRSGSLTPRRVSFSMFFVCGLVVGMIALRCGFLEITSFSFERFTFCFSSQCCGDLNSSSWRVYCFDDLYSHPSSHMGAGSPQI